MAVEWPEGKKAAASFTFDVDGDYEELFGLSQLSYPTYTVTDPGTTLPFGPIDVDPATAKSTTNGEQYEGVLCRIVGPVDVTQKNADNPTDDPANTSDFDEFAIASFLAPGGSPTFPVFVYTGARTPLLQPEVIAIGSIVVVASLVLVIGAELVRRWWERRIEGRKGDTAPAFAVGA